MVIDENELKRLASVCPKHLNLKTDYWRFTKWRESEVNFNPRKIVNEMEVLEYEAFQDKLNGRNTTQLPIQEYKTNNVILQIGMRESIDRDIAVSSSNLNFNSIGTSATAESETQTDLQAEDSGGPYVRKNIGTLGQRTRVNQTMKIGMVWDDTDVSAVPITIRESGIHWTVSTATNCHARVVTTSFILAAGDLFVVQINELQENGTL